MASGTIWSKTALLEVARGQKQVLWLIVIALVILFPVNYFVLSTNSPSAVNIIRGVGLLFGIAQLFSVWMLAKALRSRVPWLYCVLAFIPCISLISLLYLSQTATKILTTHGIKVGFMGANVRELEKNKYGPEE